MRQSGASEVLGIWLGGLGVIKGGAGSAYLQPHILRLEQMHFQIDFRLNKDTQNSQYHLHHWKKGVCEKCHTTAPSLKVNQCKKQSKGRSQVIVDCNDSPCGGDRGNVFISC